MRAHNIKGSSEWSKPLRVLTRRKAVEGGCDNGLYKWMQTRGELIIQLAVGIQAPTELGYWRPLMLHDYSIVLLHHAHRL